MTTTTTQDNRISTQEARERLTQAVENLRNEDTWKAWLDLKARMHDYSMNNLMLILMQCRDASIVGGAKNFWKPLGRFPMKGTKALRIFAPMIGKKKDDDGKERTYVYGYKLVPVFDASQTDGTPMPDAPTIDNLAGDAPAGMIEDLIAVANAEGVTVRFEPIEGGTNGYYQKDAKLIVVDSTNDSAQRAKTLAHELGHHFDLNRTENPSRRTAEIVAESTAYIIAQSRGMDTSTYSTGYVAAWAVDVDQVRDAAHRIDKAASAILKALDALGASKVAVA